MIILDTNILSSLMQKKPDKRIIKWLDEIDPQLIWTTSITVFEIKYGIELLASGKKKNQLHTAFETMLRLHYHNRVIEFEINSALATGELAAVHKKAGHNVDARDLQIAGIALSKGASIATRNEKDFQYCNLDLINPWGIE